MKKNLSIIIPAYNTEDYIARCLDSILFNKDIIDLLDVIVVNDGSSDNTLKIAEKYQNIYPNSVRVIDKQNGGHGSTVNAGMDIAVGKFFKVIDSDDWVNIRDFARYVKYLGDADADIIVSNYKKDILYDTSTISFDFSTKNTEPISIENIDSLIGEEDFFFMFSMHSMAIKTEALRKVWKNGLPEKTFYVDQVYVAKALQGAKSYAFTNFDIYRYFIGRPEQSVSGDGFFRHRKDHERVLRTLLEISEQKNLEERIKKVYNLQISLMIDTHYKIYLENRNTTSETLKELKKFDGFLRSRHPELIEDNKYSKRLASILYNTKCAVKKILKMEAK